MSRQFLCDHGGGTIGLCVDNLGAMMSIAAMDEQTLKTILKAAIVEVLEERPDLLRAIIEEALEDAGLVAAIDEGLRTGPLDRADILAVLDTV